MDVKKNNPRKGIKLAPGPGGTAVNQSKEQLSLAYIQALCAAAGLNYDPPVIDNDGIDITIRGKDFPGKIARPRIEIQLKCTSNISKIDMENETLSFSLPASSYNPLAGENLYPAILVVHLAPDAPEEWLQIKDLGTTIRFTSYWCSLKGRDKLSNDKSKKVVKIPLSQRLDTETLLNLMHKVSNREEIENIGKGGIV